MTNNILINPPEQDGLTGGKIRRIGAGVGQRTRSMYASTTGDTREVLLWAALRRMSRNSRTVLCGADAVIISTVRNVMRSLWKGMVSDATKLLLPMLPC